LSALQLQRQLGIARYETAWVMLHKLRRAMVRPDRAPLHTEVEVDEAYIGGPEAGLRGGRVLEDKALVVAAVEVRGRGSGRIRLQVVPDASARSLSGFVRANVEPGTVVRTDGWPGYAPLTSMSYRHRPRTRGTDPRRASKLWPRVHRVFGNLQTWLRGDPSRGRPQASAGLPRRVHVPVQPSPYAAGRLSNAPRSRHSAGTHDLPAVV